MKEIYKDIENYENRFQVSNLGNVKVLIKKNKDIRSKPFVEEHLLKQNKNTSGYMQVAFYKNGKTKNRR